MLLTYYKLAKQQIPTFLYRIECLSNTQACGEQKYWHPPRSAAQRFRIWVGLWVGYRRSLGHPDLEGVTPLLYNPIGLDLERAKTRPEAALKRELSGDHPRRPGDEI